MSSLTPREALTGSVEESAYIFFYVHKTLFLTHEDCEQSRKGDYSVADQNEREGVAGKEPILYSQRMENKTNALLLHLSSDEIEHVPQSERFKSLFDEDEPGEEKKDKESNVENKEEAEEEKNAEEFQEKEITKYAKCQNADAEADEISTDDLSSSDTLKMAKDVEKENAVEARGERVAPIDLDNNTNATAVKSGSTRRLYQSKGGVRGLRR